MGFMDMLVVRSLAVWGFYVLDVLALWFFGVVSV